MEQSVSAGVQARRPFTLEYRIQRRDGGERWVLERGQAQAAGDGRRWLDGAIFDVTARRAAEQALREHEIVEAQLTEVRSVADRRSSTRPTARGAISSATSMTARSSASCRSRCNSRPGSQSSGELSDDARGEFERVLGELRSGLAELRDLAHGLRILRY